MKLSRGEWISRCIECFIDIDVPKLQAKYYAEVLFQQFYMNMSPSEAFEQEISAWVV
jgi:hypothetical protein